MLVQDKHFSMEGQNQRQRLHNIVKRDGRTVSFDKQKISDAIFKSAQAVGGEDRLLADELANAVVLYLEKNFQNEVPGIEQIQDIVEKVLIETGHAKTAKAYILYREQRRKIREILKVRKKVKSRANSTDLSLLVTPLAKDEILNWDKGRIALALEKEANITEDLAMEIASSVEKKVFNSGLTRISTALIRELVDNELFERGLDKTLSKQSIIGMPTYDLEQLLFSKSCENSNIASNNPEAVNLSIAETILKQYILQKVFSDEVANAHLYGMIHIHDLGYPRAYCGSHSLEYLKKYGLELGNLFTSSAPAKYARTLTGHLNTFLASLQAYYAGALGIAYVNIMYAPLVENLTDEEMKQEAQYLIFSASQNAFSRGSQSLFIDFNVHTGVPGYLANIPAIGAKGQYTGRTYGDYEETVIRFAKAMLDVWRDGDRDGRVFAFPKCDLHISNETFEDPRQLELLRYACLIASENGTPYFVFDRGNEAVLSQCCRLRQKINDIYMIEHPESMRFCGFQNVTINLPQAAYRSGKGNVDGLLKEIGRVMDIAAKAHLEKKEFVSRLSEPGMPMWEVGKPAKDGRPYIDLEKATYIIGLIGLNECVQYITGKELHESDEIFKLGLKIVSFMNQKTKEYEKNYGLKFSLEESPAESACRRLPKVDLRQFPEAASVIKGDIDNDRYYYTNSIHFRADAPVDLLTRIQKQSKFHTLIESGAIIHAFVGEQKPAPESILNLVKKTFLQTQTAQLTISPEFTMCNSCLKTNRGLDNKCKACGSPDVYNITRIVGYFSRVNNWNPSKLAELSDRQLGNYKVQEDAGQ
ncbi:MAG: anaerobic ribonucleoside-triphosphate reductase [Candidatus Omnitrophica bacterium]|nr:anaerobic ribonucleoside-triphosphate reductase [Candidatus Omnitrophota bacterium]MBU4479005.1 anaerobic ribonucleoside-triphosphate reductase [Candidatus Omnitrophota bacterium]MCG2703800.1 anaerobic ribonucleoside-triphosphate reductase [Candidatus Omnitrophota bacterium]MCG2711299.1 anaerobic ribonucleoside-triphosphate reductase [Candidatus Omnitrophota bacterium]